MNNPIIQRELIGLLRTRRAVVVQVLLVVALGVLVVLRWPSGGTVDLSRVASTQVLRVFGYGLMAGLILLAPVFPATSIVRERVQGTLALLLNSPLSALSIVAGKLVGALGYILLLVVLSLPAAAACWAMGGIDLSRLGLMYVVLIATAVSYASLGLLVSSYARSTDGALRATYGIILILAVVCLGPYQFFGGTLDEAGMADRLRQDVPAVGPGLAMVVEVVGGLLAGVGLGLPVIVDWLRSASPLSAIAVALGDGSAGSGGLLAQGDVVWRFLLICVLITAGSLGWTVRRLHQRMLDRPREAGTITDERSTGAQAYRRLMYLWFFDPQRRSGLIGPLANPVMVKEQRTRKLGRGNWMMRLLGATAVISLALMLAAANASTSRLGGGAGDPQAVQKLGGVIVVLQVALIMLLTPALASGLISAERESRGWQLLQMTPMSAVTIVVGKLASVAVILLLLLAATLPGYLVLLYIKPSMSPVVVQVLASLVLTSVMALLVSAAISSLFEKTAAATTAAYVLLIGLCGGTMLIWLGRDAPFGHGLVEAVLRWNPLAAMLDLLGTPGFGQYELVEANWWIMSGLCVTALLVLVVQVWRLTRPT